ncbi:sugar nucleotide-binding protein, partial [Acinetobacter baumannii]
YTKVYQAESEPELAYMINGYGSENIAVACNRLDVPMLYVSSDYVFDGEHKRPYQPWDQTGPLSIYGKTKLSGERAVRNHLSKFYI